MGEVPHRPLKITLYASYTFFEYVLFAYFIYLNLVNGKAKKAITYTSVAFCLFIIVYYLTVKFKRIDSVPIGVETILIIIFSFYYLYEETNNSSTLFIYSKPVFWVIFGMVLYLSGSFFIYIFASSLSREEVERYWWITNALSILKNIFFCIAILIHSRPNKIDHTYNLDLGRLN